MSTDYTDIPWRGYIRQILSSAFLAFPLINANQYKPFNGYYSAYHGLIITNGAAYANYFHTIHTDIDYGGISIWFFQKATGISPLISASSSSGAMHFTYSIISGYLNAIPEGGTNTPFLQTISTNQWHHALIIWKRASPFETSFTLDGVSTSTLSLGCTPSTPLTQPFISIGAVMLSATSIDPSNVFIGYIRRIELIDTSFITSSIPLLNNYFVPFAKQFLSFTDCSAMYSPCNFCDKFTMQCFSTFSPEQTPDGSFTCPSNCSTVYSTSCDMDGGCSICDDQLCVSCSPPYCIKCKSGSVLNSAGACECETALAFNTATQSCEACDVSCVSCTLANDPTKCSSCGTGLSFLVSATKGTIKEGKCLTACPEAMIVNFEGICEIKCHSSCLTCSSANDMNKCTSCPIGYLLAGFNEGSCGLNCPNNTAYSIETSKCLPCHSTCGTCLVANNSEGCLTCNSQTPYKTETFTKSVGNCSAKCSTDLETYTDVVNMQCYSYGKCPITTYKNSANKSCMACHESCFGCTKPFDANQCKGCAIQPYYLRLATRKKVSGTCLQKCYEGDYLDPKIMLCYGEPVSLEDQKRAEAITSAVSSATYSHLYSFN